MKRLTILIAALCAAAALAVPARAQGSDEERQAREERERDREEREEIARHIEREREGLRAHLEKEHMELRARLAHAHRAARDALARDTLEEIRIRSSGKKSRDVLILRYGKDGRDLISVIDNGKIVSRKDFEKYRIRLEEALEAREIDELRPRLEELERILESRRRTDEEKIEALKEVIEEMKRRESETAVRARDLYIARLGALDGRRLAVDPLLLPESRAGDRMTIRVREDGCYLHGKRLPDDLCERLREIHEAFRRLPHDEDEWKEREEKDR